MSLQVSQGTIALVKGVQELILPDFGGGIPKAAIVFSSLDGVPGEQYAAAAAGLGVIDNLGNQVLCMAESATGQTTTSSRRRQTVGSIAGVQYSTSGAYAGRYSGELIQNGIRFTNNVTSNQNVRVNVILLGGSDLQAFVKVDAAFNSLAISDVPFQPNFGYHIHVGHSSASSNDFVLGVGCNIDTAAQTASYSHGHSNRSGVTTDTSVAAASNTSFVTRTSTAGTSITTSLQWSAFTPNGMTWTLTGSSSTELFHSLFLNVANDQVAVSEKDLVSAVGLWQLDASPLTSLGGAAYFDCSHVTSWDVATGSFIWGFGVLMSGKLAGDSYSMSWANLDAQSTSDAHSKWGNEMDLLDYVMRDVPKGSYSGFNAPFIEYDVAIGNNSAGVKGWMIAFGASAGTGVTGVKLGSLDVDAIKLGVLNVDSVYLGANQIF